MHVVNVMLQGLTAVAYSACHEFACAVFQHKAGLLCPLQSTITVPSHVAHLSMLWMKVLFHVCTGSSHMARAITVSKRRLQPQLGTLQSPAHPHQVVIQSSCPGHLSCQGLHQCQMTTVGAHNAGAIRSSQTHLLHAKLNKRPVLRLKMVNKHSHKHSPTGQQEGRRVKKT